MTDDAPFDPFEFLPYLLDQAAEAQSSQFRPAYKEQFGMLRTEWRVLFHLGQYGDLTAKEICEKAHLHKTKTSRAVAALVAKRFIVKTQVPTDRRHELLSLAPMGRKAYAQLHDAARAFDAALQERLGRKDTRVLKRCLKKLVSD